MKDVSFFVGYLGFASSVVICGHGRNEQEKQWSVRLERHWLCSAEDWLCLPNSPLECHWDTELPCVLDRLSGGAGPGATLSRGGAMTAPLPG